MRVLSVFGTRPEAIKMAPIIKELGKRPDIQSYVCVTAQHRQMLDQVLDLFEITPDYDLDIMVEGQTLASLTASVFTRLDPVLTSVKPDWVMVQGDTTTVMAAGLAAFYRGIKIAHVEAGLRTYDKHQPFPEEVNRRMVSCLADLHFAPTEWAARNLLREGISSKTIIVTGNPVIDALHMALERPCPPDRTPLCGIPWEKKILLVTAHRRENFGSPLESICRGLKQIAERYREQVHIVYPVHPNPQVQGKVYGILGNICNVDLLEPLDYRAFVHLLQHCHLVLTDSGGLQEEAPGLGKPVLVLRQLTERPEGVEAGTVKLVGTDSANIVREVGHLLDCSEAYCRMAQAVNPYGDGRASRRMIDALAEQGAGSGKLKNVSSDLAPEQLPLNGGAHGGLP